MVVVLNKITHTVTRVKVIDNNMQVFYFISSRIRFGNVRKNMQSSMKRVATIVAMCFALSGCATFDRLTKGPSCYGGEEAVVGKCHDDNVPSDSLPGWWRVASVRVSGESVHYAITNVPAMVFLDPSSAIDRLEHDYPYKGIKTVTR